MLNAREVLYDIDSIETYNYLCKFQIEKFISQPSWAHNKLPYAIPQGSSEWKDIPR